MITFIYYGLWVLLFLICAMQIGTVYLFIKRKKNITKYLIPYFFNYIIGLFGFFLIVSTIIFYTYGEIITLAFILTIILSFLIIMIPNVLLYYLYYKKKNKLTKKEYIISSLYGFSVVIMLFLKMQLF